ncbi:MAG: PKD domain-containing protein [Bacteroidia bacterium]|nr:PKD domain-containing protein [Bacteroidia bacterium]
MKIKFTKTIKVLSFFLVLLTAGKYKAQCSANFTYALNSNGNVTFTAAAQASSVSPVTYYWTFGSSIPTFSATGNAGKYPNYTYTANGTYVVTLFIIQTAPSCSTQTQQTITITNATTSTCNINANFTTSQGSNGLVNFNNTSTGTVSGVTYNWNFGDNTTPSTATSPVHTYSANGTYIATLTANNNLSVTCAGTKTLAIVVNSYCTLAANFTYSLGSNGAVSFFNTTTPSVSVSYTWNFGNSSTSNALNPSIAYAANGTYTVILSAATASCSSTASAVLTITNVPLCNITANFSYSQGANGLINFNNTSTGTVSGVSYSWNFGDNSTAGTTASPAHTYSANGTYVATLTANNNFTPACVSTKTLNIVVSSYCTLAAGFTYTVGANGLVSFNNTTTGTGTNTIYSWNFGNAGTSTSVNPTRSYLNGTYTVVLTASNFSVFPACSSTVSQVITVTTSTCVSNTTFTLLPTSTPKFWNAIPSNTANIASVLWSWGDGNTSNTLYTSHLYSVSATYTICLSVTLTCGASSTFCTSYFVYRGSSENSSDMIQVNVIEEGSLGIKNIEIENNILSVYPNPGTGLFTLKMNVSNEKTKVTVYNVMGQKVYEGVNEAANGKMDKQVDLSKAEAGVYFVEVIDGTKIVSKKIVVSK